MRKVEDSVKERVVKMINEVVGDEFRSERLEEYNNIIQQRLDVLDNERESAKLHTALIRRDRQNKLQYIAESNGRVLVRAREVLGMVETVSGQVGDIVSRTVRLDRSQRNLTLVITMLERFRAFMDNIDRLERLLVKGEFDQMAALLLATQQFAAQFEVAKNEAPLAAEQISRLAHLQQMMKRQIMDLFEGALRRRGNSTASDSIRLAHAASVVDVLGEEAKVALIRWYCERQLGDYKDVFRGNRELFTLESVPKRYAWLKRLLIAYEAEHAMIFLEPWRVDLALCLDFCSITTKDLSELLLSQRNGSAMDLVLLQACVQQTRQFEQFLMRKFKADRSCGLLLSLAFEPYLSYFVEAHDRDIGEFIKGLPCGKRLSLGDVEASNVLASAPELFLLFKEVLLDISELSVKKPLADLCSVFAKHLSGYAKYLERALPPTPSSRSPKDLPAETIRLLCVLVNTCDYCVVTLEQMETKLVSLIDAKCKDEVNFEAAKQEFLVQLSMGTSRLHQLFSGRVVETAWTVFNDANYWSNLRAVGDHGDYINKISTILTDLYAVRSNLVEAKHYVTLCNRLAMGILRRFSDSIQRVRPLTEIVAQQLLIDLEALKACLQGMLRTERYGILRDSFIKLVNGEAGPIERLLKCLLLQPEPISFFVQNYIMIAAEGEEAKFIKILELKGVKKSQQAPFVEEFRKLIPQKPSDQKVKGKESEFSKLNAQLKKIMSSFSAAGGGASSSVQ